MRVEFIDLSRAGAELDNKSKNESFLGTPKKLELSVSSQHLLDGGEKMNNTTFEPLTTFVIIITSFTAESSSN